MKTIEDYYDKLLTKKYGENDYSKEVALFGASERQSNDGIKKTLTIMAGILLIMWICCLTGVFDLSNFKAEVYVIPINMVMLCLPHVFTKTNIHNSAYYKDFLLTLLTLVIFIINVTFPKHGIIGWALVIIVASHYYSARTVRFAFIITALLMLLAIYLGMLYGEWDSNLLLGKYHTLHGVDITQYSTAAERWNYLIDTLNIYGENRFLTAALYYYFPRLAFIGLVTTVCIRLCDRSKKLIYEQALIVVEQQKNETELAFATDIQVKSLPTNFKIEGHDEVDIYALTNPAKQVGGDFYDFYMIDENHLAFLMADVSGKGVPAALFMMQSRIIIKSLAFEHHPIDELVRISNERMCSNNSADLFVTCWLGVLDLTSGEVDFVNAGHNFPLVKKANGSYEYIKERHGMPLATMDGLKYRTGKFKLEKGDSIFLYTDGVTEAANVANELYGDDRLLSACNSKSFATSEELAKLVREDVGAFANGAEQADDITVMALRLR